MYCPKCGAAEQSTETFCRKCGTFLPDFDKLVTKETPVEQNILINSTFSVMTAVVSLSLAITLYVMFVGRDGAPWIIYLVFGFLMAMTAWQVQTFIRTRMLKKQLERMKPNRGEDVAAQEMLKPADTSRLLDEANLKDAIPASVIENPTKNLVPKSSQTKH